MPQDDRRATACRRSCAARLRRAAAHRGGVHAARAAGTDAAGDGARARGISAAGRCRHAVDRQAPLRRHRGAIDAPDSRRARARARRAEALGAARSRVADRLARRRGRSGGAMLPALDEALTRLEQIDAEQARIVELRYFVGLSIEETADALDISPATLKRRWALARAWLFRELSGGAAVTPRSSAACAICSRRRSIATPASAARWLAREAADDPAVRDEVLSLLDAPLARRRIPRRSRSADAAPDLLADDEPLAAGHDRRQLHDRARARTRRHGPRLPGDRRAARTHGRAQSAGAASGPRCRAARAAAAGGARGRGADASGHLHGLRARGDRRRAVHRRRNSSTGGRCATRSRRGRAPSAADVVRTARDLASALAARARRAASSIAI